MQIPETIVDDPDQNIFDNHPHSFNIAIFLDRSKMMEQKDGHPASCDDWGSGIHIHLCNPFA
jgi:hypothetical protein